MRLWCVYVIRNCEEIFVSLYVVINMFLDRDIIDIDEVIIGSKSDFDVDFVGIICVNSRNWNGYCSIMESVGWEVRVEVNCRVLGSIIVRIYCEVSF